MGSEPSCKSKLHPLKKRSAHKSGVTIRSKNGILRLVSPSRFLHFCQQKTFTHPSNTCAAVSIESLNTQKRIQLFEPRPPGKNLSYDLRFFVAPSLDKSSPLSPHITARSPSEYPVTSCPPTCRDISFFVTAPPAYALHAEKSQESLTFLKPSSCCPDSRHPCDATGSRARLKCQRQSLSHQPRSVLLRIPFPTGERIDPRQFALLVFRAADTTGQDRFLS
jgi:hypothetical protein